MSGTTGPTPPPEDPSEPAGGRTPPYPGWSQQQPPTPGWGGPAPQAGGTGWQAPGASEAPGEPSAPQWGGAPGWGTTQGGSWQRPDVKPGVIPLRPLGVGEILDGAVTTIRRNPGAMLGLSAAVAIVTQVLGLFATWTFFEDATTVGQLGATATPDQLLSAFGTSLSLLLITAFITWLGTVFLTGVLTVVVGRAVLGEKLSAAQAWQAAKGRLLPLLGLTVLYTLIWSGALIGSGILAIVVGVAGNEAVAGLLVLVAVAAFPVAIWLYVTFSLAGPSLMLETTTSATGEVRPVGIIGSLRRSRQLVSGSWWRVFGILLLVLLIVSIITNVIAVPFSLPWLFADGATGSLTFGALAVSALGGIVGATITAPFSAAATALLYVDRRIRREGLDIELARAAGVDLPGRSGDTGGPPTEWQ